MSSQSTRKAYMIDIAMRFLGKFYIWGGDDPSGFDCSGFVIECLKSIGVLSRDGDWTAQTLWDLLQDRRTNIPTGGCLVFWKNNQGKVIHVEICLNDELSIGASGGGSRTLTIEDAIKQNAFIKVRPFRSRLNIAGFIDLFTVEYASGKE